MGSAALRLTRFSTLAMTLFAATAGCSEPSPAARDGATVDCPPEWCLAALASGRQPTDITVDAASLYFTDEIAGTVSKIARDGGEVVVLTSGQNFPRSIAVDGLTLYWTNYGSFAGPNGGDGAIMSVPVTGGEVQTLASGLAGPSDVATDPAGVYWGTLDAVMMVPRAGGAPVVIASGIPNPSGIVVRDGSVYWAANGNVMRAPLVGGAPVPVATGQNYPRDLAVDATNVYWTSMTPWAGGGDGDGTVMTAPLSGGSAVDLVSAVTHDEAVEIPTDGVISLSSSGGVIALDSSHVFWTIGNGMVLRVPLAGGVAEVLATARRSPMAMAIDSGSVYWILGDRRIFELALD